MASVNLKFYLLVLGVVIFGIGYIGLLLTVMRGELGGVIGLASVLMATGVLIAGIFGVLLAKYTVEVLGEL